MNAQRLLNSLVILTLLGPTLPTSDRAPTRALTEPLDILRTNETIDGLILHPHPGAGYEEHSPVDERELTDVPSTSLGEFNASLIQTSAGSHTWDSDADFVSGAFDHTEVVSGTGQVRLPRRWSTNTRANDDPGSVASGACPSLVGHGGGYLYLAWEDYRTSN